MNKTIHTLLVILVALGLSLVACRSNDEKTAGTDRGRSAVEDTSTTDPVHQRRGSNGGTVRGDTTVVRSVDDGSRPATRRLTSVDDRVVRANTAFAFKLLGNTCENNTTENIFISPLSVSIALSMTANGATGTTAEAMADVLKFSGIEPAELNQTMADIQTALELADSSVKMTIANSLWGHRGVQFNEGFFERNRHFYGAEVSTLDFASPEALPTINGWVSDSTNGLIDKILDRISRDAVLYLINAIYFKGQWTIEFDPSRTEPLPFHRADGGDVSVPMMNQSDSYRYAEDDIAQVVRLPYGKDRLAMYVFLPRPSRSLNEFLDGLDEETWTAWMARLVHVEGDVRLPRFKIEYECTLNDGLIAMGMGVAFSPEAANFSGMLADSESSEDLYISLVKHKAVVDVNEEGTEAAAVTAVEIERTSIEVPRDRFTFTADRPFFFAIRDDLTGSIVFMGTLHDPSPSS